MLDMQPEENQRVQELEERAYRQRQWNLISRGVTSEHAALLPTDGSVTWPTPITKDLAASRRKTLEEETRSRKQQAKDAFELPWLKETEKDLHECTIVLSSAQLDSEKRATMEAYQEVLEDKLKNYHQNLGTLKCKFALEERKRSCVAQGLLRNEHRKLVTSLFQTLPLIEASPGNNHASNS
ncbi:hypothetical protein OS493_022806 [Desmophyllum pertusum]|uniref:Uncharacterized protein n=1 Tax=Desmophyllum pertusum TaxID=174260 RepID=A0A9X0A082_9CNID|nr:hypothetical protein OS493_022806 [Desmophyllum pertusum]